MKVFVVVLLAVAGLCNAFIDEALKTTAYGYHSRFGIPELARIAENEEQASRIVGGSTAALGTYPFQAGLIISLVGTTGQSVCGASLVSTNRLTTAAHCWSDGVNQASAFQVVLGSITLFTGGTRITTSNVIVHPNWLPTLIRNDIAVIQLPNAVATSNAIAPIALPSGNEINNNFAGQSAIASGFGLNWDGMTGIPANQQLHHVTLNIISNTECSIAFPFIIQSSNICTSGAGGRSTCSGDSGGPLSVLSGNRRVLVGVTSFGSARGCEQGYPAAFARVTSFLTFIQQHM